jgi:hypothetical protein
MASRQETSVQTSNPFSVPFPFSLSDALARAYVRAQEAHPGTAPSARDIFAAFAQGHPPQGHTGAPAEAGAGDGTDPGAICGLLDVAELLAVMREPIAWVFTLAERRAQGDAVDLATIARVRDAVLHRVDAISVGIVAGEPPRIRAADLLTVAGLLVGTLDPSIVRHAVQTLGAGMVEAFGALWPLVPSLAGDAEDAPGACCGSCPGSGAPDPGIRHVHCDHITPRIAPWANPYATPFGVALGGPHTPRPPAPPWYWPLLGYPF